MKNFNFHITLKRLKLKRALLIEQLYFIEHKIKGLEMSGKTTNTSSKEDKIDWEAEVLEVLKGKKTPHSKSEIANILESKFKVGHSTAMRRVSQVLVSNKSKKLKKVKVGKSYRYLLNIQVRSV